MRNQIRPAIILLLVLTLLTGVVYPLTVTAIARALFPSQSQGSLIMINGHPAGSRLIGQSFTDPKYFWPRPSATTPIPYAADAGSGSNLAISNPAQITVIQQRAAALRAADPDNHQPIPPDLLTASASGLDPHISPAAAEYQINRIARARHIPPEQLRHLVERYTTDRTFSALGQPRVNVLELNLALDAH